MIPRFLLMGVGKIVRRPILRHLAAFEQATHSPRLVQEALLQRIIARHQDSDFGRDHHFSGIRNKEDFRRHLPIAGYEYVAPYIERVRRGDIRALLGDKMVHMFALTSGTTAARKFIPVTPQYLADYRRGWNIWGLRVFRDHNEVRVRPIVQMSSDWEEFHTEAGIPCGSVTGLTATMQKRLIRFLYCVPACTAKIRDTASKYYVVLRLSLPKRIGMMIAANPSTLVNLARTGDQEKERLIKDLFDGTLSSHVDVSDSVRTALARTLRRRHPVRARELEAIVHRTGTLYPRDYWPSDCILGNWTGGSVAAYLRHFPRYFGTTPVRDVGLIASEGRMTIPIADGTPGGVLDITSHFFEFIPEEEIDSSRPLVLGAHELVDGRNYFILPTTAFGFYRYDIHDLVRCVGHYHQTPILEFLGKGAHFANLTGEKLSEYHVTEAMATVLREMSLSLTSYSVAPCWDDELPYYGVFLERGDLVHHEQGGQLAAALDRALCRANVEYQSKRESLRLGALRVEYIPSGTWLRWDRERLAKSGGTAEQYKHPCLIPDPQFRSTMPLETETAARQTDPMVCASSRY